MEISNEKKQQDFATNKLLIVFTMIFVGIFAAMYGYRMANASASGYLTIANASKGLFYTSIVASGISAIKWYFDSKKEVENPYKILTAKHLFSCFIVVAVCSGLANHLSIIFSVKYIYTILAAIAVQYFILVTYTKDIYLMAITNMVNLVLVYGMNANIVKSLLCAIISIALLAAVYVFVEKTKENKGKVKDYVVFKKNTNYKMLTTNSIILAGITVVSFILAVMGYSVGIIIGGIYLIVIIFYNTLKLL